jgi:hypothetical protein
MKTRRGILFILTLELLIIPVAGQQKTSETLYFRKVREPNEGAFELLVPKGWQTMGGVYRVNPALQGGAAQSVAAKNDFAVYNNPSADVMIRWLPDNLFIDMRGTPAAAMFPQGSNNNGMTVLYKMDPFDFILNVAFPYAHPQAQNVGVTDKKLLKGLASAHSSFTQKIIPGFPLTYAAAQVNLRYSEEGKTYEELFITVLEDWGTMGAGMWGNKSTLFARAPEGSLQNWLPVIETVHRSIRIDQNWLMKEIEGQQVRANTMLRVQSQVQQIDRDIQEAQQKMNSEIQNDMYLLFTEQEEYINPHTNEVEVGNNHWKHRWQNELGEIIYTDDESYDPNTDVHLNASGFKRSPVRKR